MWNWRSAYSLANFVRRVNVELQLKLGKMIQKILQWTGLDPDSCAELLRVSKAEFSEWLAGQPVPTFVDRDLATLVGVSVNDIRQLRRQPDLDLASKLSPILFKIRSEQRLTPDDQKAMAALRYLGGYGRTLNSISIPNADALWSRLKSRILEGLAGIDCDSHEKQGRLAARAFREAMQFGVQAIGRVVRPRLRKAGLLFFESALSHSDLRGACFVVGDDHGSVPCIFVNSYACSWFQRNEVLLHELCHAIFDLLELEITLDLEGDDSNDPREVRANAFALEAILPLQTLVHYCNQLGTSWEELGEDQLAQLVAETHTQASSVLKQAQVHGLISQSQFERYSQLRPGTRLKQYSESALSRKEFLEKHPESLDALIRESQLTSYAPKSMWLSAGYVQMVLEAVKAHKITAKLAAQMLFISDVEFNERFQESLDLHLVEA